MLVTSEKPLIYWRLREIMARRKMTNRQLAALTGMHVNTISRIKNLETLIDVRGETLEKLCRALHCTPGDLLQYVEDDHRDQHPLENG